MIGDRLTLAVGVRPEENLFCGFGGLFQLFDDLALAPNGDVVGLEAVLDIDAQVALGEITDVTHRRLDDELVVQVPTQRACLRRRLDDQ